MIDKPVLLLSSIQNKLSFYYVWLFASRLSATNRRNGYEWAQCLCGCRQKEAAQTRWTANSRVELLWSPSRHCVLGCGAALMRCFWTVTTVWSSCRNISISNHLYEACCQAAMSSQGRECQWWVMVFSGCSLAPRVKLPHLDINNSFFPTYYRGYVHSFPVLINSCLRFSTFCILFMLLQPLTSVLNISQRTNAKLNSDFK